MEAADVVLEVLDARDPQGCRSPQLEAAVRRAGSRQRLVLVLNKIGTEGRGKGGGRGGSRTPVWRGAVLSPPAPSPRPGAAGRGGRVAEVPPCRVPHRGLQGVDAAAEPQPGGEPPSVGGGWGCHPVSFNVTLCHPAVSRCHPMSLTHSSLVAWCLFITQCCHLVSPCRSVFSCCLMSIRHPLSLCHPTVPSCHPLPPIIVTSSPAVLPLSSLHYLASRFDLVVSPCHPVTSSVPVSPGGVPMSPSDLQHPHVTQWCPHVTQ